MLVSLNKDTKYVKNTRKLIEENGGHCINCSIKDSSTECVCQDFKDKLKDENFEGYCRCEIFYKEL